MREDRVLVVVHPKFFVFLLILLSGAYASFALAQAPSRPVVVEVAPVALISMADRVEALGTLRANESTDLTSIASEVVTALNFTDGQRVERGEVLVELTSAEERALLVEAQAESQEAKKQLDRVRSLSDQDIASKALFDERQREYSTARARLIAIRSRLSDRVVVAPYSGVLGLRMVSLGQLVRPGDIVATLNDDSQMKLDFSVPEIDISTLKPGVRVVATSRAFPGQEFNGLVSSIDNQIDPVTRSIRVRALLPNPERLLIQGQLMNVELLKREREALVVPEESVVPEGKKNAVYVVRREGVQDIAEKVVVTLGQRSPGIVEVLKGLSVGDLVVTKGAAKISSGRSVTVQHATDKASIGE